MRTWVIVTLVALAGDALLRCDRLLRCRYPRPQTMLEEVLVLAAELGLLAGGVVVLRGGGGERRPR